MRPNCSCRAGIGINASYGSELGTSERDAQGKTLADNLQLRDKRAFANVSYFVRLMIDASIGHKTVKFFRTRVMGRFEGAPVWVLRGVFAFF